jgi:hypothetical protein
VTPLRGSINVHGRAVSAGTSTGDAPLAAVRFPSAFYLGAITLITGWSTTSTFSVRWKRCRKRDRYRLWCLDGGGFCSERVHALVCNVSILRWQRPLVYRTGYRRLCNMLDTRRRRASGSLINFTIGLPAVEVLRWRSWSRMCRNFCHKHVRPTVFKCHSMNKLGLSMSRSSLCRMVLGCS